MAELEGSEVVACVSACVSGVAAAAAEEAFTVGARQVPYLRFGAELRGCLGLQGAILYSGCGSAVGDSGALHGGTVCDHRDDPRRPSKTTSTTATNIMS